MNTVDMIKELAKNLSLAALWVLAFAVITKFLFFREDNADVQ